MSNQDTTDKTIQRHTTSYYELDILKEYACLGQHNILEFRRIFLLLLRNFFSNPNNFNVSIEPSWIRSFSNYTYSDPIVDPERKTNPAIDIICSYQYADNASKLEFLREGQKPQIIINIGDFNYEPYGVLDDTTGFKGNKRNIVRGSNVKCNIAISCYGRSYADAAIMSQLVSSFIIGLRPYLLGKLNLQELQPMALSTPVCINPDNAAETKTFKSDFSFQLTFESNYISSTEALTIKSFSIEADNKSLQP